MKRTDKASVQIREVLDSVMTLKNIDLQALENLCESPKNKSNRVTPRDYEGSYLFPASSHNSSNQLLHSSINNKSDLYDIDILKPTQDSDIYSRTNEKEVFMSSSCIVSSEFLISTP